MKWVNRMDPVLTGVAALASMLGVFFVWNAGYVQSARDGWLIPRDPLLQLLFFGVGVALHFWLAGKTPEQLRKWATPALLLCVGSLIAVLVIGTERNGAKRWLGTGSIGFQPSDFTKVAIILSLAVGLAVAFQRLEKYRKGEVPRGPGTAKRRRADEQAALADWLGPAILALVSVVLVAFQPDLDTAAVIASITLGMLFLGGVSLRVVLGLTLCGLVVLGVLAKIKPHAIARVTAHPHRYEQPYRDGISFQSVQSEEALRRGGLGGTGFTQGRAKSSLPEATSDYVMTTVGEEFGFGGFVVAYSLIALLVGRLWWHAMRHRTVFGKLILGGSAIWIVIQATINVTMTNGFLWTMGITMPFYSDGGSSLIALWMALGLSQAAIASAPREQEVPVAAHCYRWGHRRPHLPRA